MKRSLANSGHMAQMARRSTGAPIGCSVAVAEGVHMRKFVLFVALLTFSLFHCLPRLRPAAAAATSRPVSTFPTGLLQRVLRAGRVHRFSSAPSSTARSGVATYAPGRTQCWRRVSRVVSQWASPTRPATIGCGSRAVGRRGSDSATYACTTHRAVSSWPRIRRPESGSSTTSLLPRMRFTSPIPQFLNSS